MTTNKLVIRRLPPSMSEEEFLRQVEPLAEHDYFCFFEANPSLGSYAFSRAYINFLNSNDTANFRERFDNYIFLDRDGQEYPAVVEQSFWHKSPKTGPFFVRASQQVASTSPTKVEKPGQGDRSAGARGQNEKEESLASVGIEQDPDFLKFMERLGNSKKRSQQSPIQTLETNLDELAKQSSNGTPGKDGQNSAKVMTPLLGYVNQKRVMKNTTSNHNTNRRNKK